MGLRGATLRGAYNCAGIMPSLRETSGRPCPSLVHHSHGSMGSLEMMSGLNNPHTGHSHNPQRGRAVSTVSPQIIQLQQNWHQPNTTNSNRECKMNDRLQPRTDASSARSASWCAEVTDDEFRRLQLSDRTPRRVTRSELIIDDKCEEAFYTPMTSLRSDRIKPRECSSTRRRSPSRSCSPSPHIFSTVQLLLSSVSSEPFEGGSTASERTLSSSELPNDGQNQPQARHSFSEIANEKERMAAFEASKRMLGMAQKKNQLQVAGGDCPGQPRRLSAI
uniref:Uncharacterized protein n=1 Tax=Globodera rostochiensis TaxID=31243 RepID=A0A914H1G1_GLORO